MKKILPLLPFALLLAAAAAQAQNFETLPENEAAAPAATAPAPAGCGDDPRFGTIVEIMSGSAPVSPPLTVTPETFLNLDPEVLARLAGQMTICPDNPVLKSGRPMKKITIDFENLWDKIQRAAIKDDFETVKSLAQNFVVKAKEPQDIPPLFTPMALEKETFDKLYKAFNIKVLDVYGPHPMPVDIYLVLGGRSTVKAEMLYCGKQLTPEARKKAAEASGAFMENLSSIYSNSGYSSYSKIVPPALTALGLTPVECKY